MQQKPREGAPGVHGSEPGEPTATAQNLELLDSGNSRNLPLDPVDVFAPWADDTEKALRRRIQRAQGAATTRASRSRHGRARQLYWIAAQLSADWTFQRAPVTDLSEILAALARLFLTAGMIERLEAPDEQ